ncbi:ribosomal protein S18-alanine N-acetyltransferase [Paenibacillus timonensis]|nr:ribosomal protein S18-alanine N-acetyltransferase [Paenibacillus timonensis]MCH1638712.1 ribosomal protein S18-alanine N-acetyltransferase [Paenibacillus timonensis]
MTLADLPDVMVIEHESFSLPWSEEAFRNELTHNHFARYQIMEIQGRPIGYAGMWTILDEAHVTNIAVRTAYRGRHLGEKLLRRMMEWAAELGMVRMTLEVRVSNTVARALYEKMGFAPAGVRKGYYSDNHEDAIIMWCELPRSQSETGEGSESLW